MSVNSCCVPGCAVVKIDGVPLHSFPNPEKSAEKFKTWVFNIGGEIAMLDHHIISQNRRVCHRHFEEIHRYPTGRLSKLAIPTLHIPDMQAESLGEAMGSAFDCAPLIVTAGSSPSLQTKLPDPMPELSHFITDIKSELDPVEIKEDPQTEVAVSLDEEDQLSDADQPCEDLIPLSNDQVLLTNAQNPLTEVKVEEPELAVDETKVKVEEVEVTGPEVQGTWSGVLTAQGQDLRSAKDIADLIRTHSQQIAKLTARCNHTRRQLNNMVQLLRRRDNTISSLRAERDELATCLAGRGGTGRGGIQEPTIIRGVTKYIIETGHHQDQLNTRHTINVIVNNNKKECQKRYREQNREKLKQREAERRKRIKYSQSSSGLEKTQALSIQRNEQGKKMDALQKKRERQQRYRDQNRDKLKQRAADRRRRLRNVEMITELSTSPNIEFTEIVNEP